MENNQDKQEFLLRKAKQGDRARIALEELDQVFKELDAGILSQLAECWDSDRAYKIAVTYQITNKLQKKLQSVVTQGNSATKELMEFMND